MNSGYNKLLAFYDQYEAQLLNDLKDESARAEIYESALFLMSQGKKNAAMVLHTAMLRYCLMIHEREQDELKSR